MQLVLEKMKEFALKEMLLQEYIECDIEILPCRGLCSYYAEKGGLLVGYESES